MEHKKIKTALPTSIIGIAWAMMFFVMFMNLTAEAAENKPLVGVAWREGKSETFEATCRAIEIAGGTPVVLKQIRSADLEYTADGKIIG